MEVDSVTTSQRQSVIEDVEDKMRRLEASQNSIIETSEFLLKLASNDHSIISEVVKLWCKLLLRVHKTKKVAFVYLVNDLI